MRTYLATCIYTVGLDVIKKKEECVCISHPEEHAPPTVVTSCTACGGDKACKITTQNHCTERPTIKLRGKILFILFNLNLCINLIICQFLSTHLCKKKKCMKRRQYAAGW